MDKSNDDTHTPQEIVDRPSQDGRGYALTSALRQETSASYGRNMRRAIFFWLVLAVGTVWLWFGVSHGLWTILGLALLSSVGTILRARTLEQPSVITIPFILAGWAVFYWAMGFGGWFSRLGVVVICVMPIIAIANWLYRLDLASLQRERNELAEHFVRESLASNVSPAPFSLYLRPFSTTNRLLASALPMDIGPSMHEDQTRELVDMEALMERALRPCVPLIGLGSDNESHDGAGRIAVSDDDWQRVVSVLGTKATIRFIVPLDSPSTQWELKWLIDNNLVRETLFLMPQPAMVQANGIWTPRDQGKKLFNSGFFFYDPQARSMDVRGEWKRAISAARTLGVTLPLLTSTGAMFTLDPQSLEPKKIVPLALSLMFGKLYYLRHIVPMLLQNSQDAVDRREIVRHFELGIGFKGNTRAFALIHAAHAYIIWGDVDQAIEFLNRADAFARRGRPSYELALQMPDYINAYLSEDENETANMYRQSMDVLLRHAGLTHQARTKLWRSVQEVPDTNSSDGP